MSAFATVLFYENASVNLYCICGPILFVFGSIGEFLCICVFGQKSMHKNPGSIYFIAFNIANILLLWFVFVPFIYSHMTGFDLSIFNLIYCRSQIYMLNVLLILGSSYLVLASFDRVLVTSRNALTRQRSTIRLTFLLIRTTTSFLLLYYLHIWFLVQIQPLAPGVFLFFFKLGIYSIIMSYSSMTVTGFFPLCLMTVLSIITMKNLRQVRIHIA